MEAGDPWYSNFPDPRSKPRSMTDDQVAALVKDPEKRVGRDYLIVDVRRTDFEKYMVRGAVNIPAHGFYPCRKTWVEVLGRVPLVIFYCGSSNGRGPRVAGWFQDTLDEVGRKDSEAIVLAGGIKRWAEVQKDLTEFVHSFPAT